MNPKTTGAVIAAMRKEKKMTQADLAKRLNVSDKTVSKWENGLGFPEITQFPVLANIFNVSVDFLMTGDRSGIVIAGTAVCDIVKTVSHYPSQGMLTDIDGISRAVGGCAPNTAIDLAIIDSKLPVSVICRVGDDEYGRFLISKLQQYGIKTDKIKISQTKPTSFCDVITVPGDERTFFHARGANAEFSPQDIDINSLHCNIFHIGYILLLNEFDKEDSEYGTVMARFLHELQKRGIKTSIDTVSNSSADYSAKVLPAVKYCDYVIMNEIECCSAYNLPAFDSNGKINLSNIRTAMQNMLIDGVKEKVIIHSKDAGFCLDRSGRFTSVPSINLPKKLIKGKTGAGDAFCAGALYALYNEFNDRDMLQFAASAAACNLLQENSVDGMKNKDEILQFAERYGFTK